MSNDFKNLYEWYCAHSIDDDEKWYFDMILSLNGIVLYDTVLCLYINELEKNTINWEYDLVFDYIRKRTRTMLLGDTIIAWNNYVLNTKEVYSESYEEMEQVFNKFIINYPKEQDKNSCYKEFITELISIYQKSNVKPKSI